MRDYYGNTFDNQGNYAGTDYGSSEAFADRKAASDEYQQAAAAMRELEDSGAGDKTALMAAQQAGTLALQHIVATTQAPAGAQVGPYEAAHLGKETIAQTLLRQSTGVDARDASEKELIKPAIDVTGGHLNPLDEAPALVSIQKSLATPAAVVAALWWFL